MDDCVASPCGVEVSCDVCSIWGSLREEGLSNFTAWSSVFMFKLKRGKFQITISINRFSAACFKDKILKTKHSNLTQSGCLTWAGYVQLCLPSSAYCSSLPDSNPSRCHNAVWPSATDLARLIAEETMNNTMNWTTCATKACCFPGTASSTPGTMHLLFLI